jgi:PAS domain S-box-containing protein
MDDAGEGASTDRGAPHDLLLESMGVGVYGLDLNGVTTFVNRRAAEILGWEPEELLNKPQHGIIHHSHANGEPYEREDCPIYAAFNDGAVHSVDNEVFWRKDGTYVPVEYVSTPMIDDNGTLTGAVVTFRDVTRQKEAEVAVQRLQDLNESILHSAGEGIYGLDLDGRTTFANPAALDMLGWSREELLQEPQHDLIHHSHANGDPYSREDCPIYAALQDGAIRQRDDEVFWRRDGSSLPVEYVSTPIIGKTGQITGAVVSFIDITERKRRQKDLEGALTEVRELRDRLERENEYLLDEIEVDHNFKEIIGNSPALRQTVARFERVAQTDATVLITGETGVGKELFARAVHHSSSHTARPFVKVNCAALPENLIESELFGHEKGAFTGATSKRIGRFELADGGTLFLDEIGELPIELQPKLLRVLQEGEFERIGGTRTLRVDVRIIAATNRDLAKEVWAGNFRDDLFYRLNVFPVEVPPLRERREDIPLLVSHFVQKYSARMGRHIDHVPASAQEGLAKYEWPGNVRELENIIERGVILATDGTIRIDEALAMYPPSDGRSADETPTEDRRSLEAVERDHILRVLDLTSWQIEGANGAAPILEMHANTLRSRMKKLGIRKKVSQA